MNNKERTPQSIAVEITIDANNGVIWNQELYEKEMKLMLDEYLSKALLPYQWIDVKDLPEESGEVLGLMKDTLSIYVCHFRKDQKLFQVWGAGRDPISDMKVTHWMPLPKPPIN